MLRPSTGKAGAVVESTMALNGQDCRTDLRRLVDGGGGRLEDRPCI